MIKKIIISAILLLTFSLANSRPGDEMFPLQLTDINAESCWLTPSCGVPVVVFYEEFGDIDSNDLFFSLISGLAGSKRITIYKVVNMEPTWYLPNSFIYHEMRKAVKNSKEALYLFDDSQNLKIKWRLKEKYSGSAVLISAATGCFFTRYTGAWNLMKRRSMPGRLNL